MDLRTDRHQDLRIYFFVPNVINNTNQPQLVEQKKKQIKYSAPHCCLVRELN